MDVTGDRQSFKTFQEPRRKTKIRLINKLPVILERIGTVGDYSLKVNGMEAAMLRYVKWSGRFLAQTTILVGFHS